MCVCLTQIFAADSKIHGHRELLEATRHAGGSVQPRAEVEATFGVAGLVLENKSYVNSV